MEKSSCMDMDIEDWELLQVPNATAFEFGIDSGKDLPLSETNFGSAAAFVDSHYFVLPSKNQELVENSTPAKAAREEEEEEELKPLVEFKDIGVDHYSLPELGSRENIVALPISSGNDERRSRRDEGTDNDDEEEEGCVEEDAEEQPCRRWRLVGGTVAGALCSIAAAIICVVALGGRRQPNYQTRSRSQRFPFQIYADEKRIKQVMQQATRLNHALTAARGVPTTTTRTTRADISFGGYYDGLWSEL